MCVCVCVCVCVCGYGGGGGAERGVERGSARRPSLKGGERAIVNPRNIGTVSIQRQRCGNV